MENQTNNVEKINAPAIVIIVGVVFAAIIFYAASQSFGCMLLGAVIGLITAIFFNSVILPYKPHDR